MIWKNSESIGTNLDLIKVVMYVIMKLSKWEGEENPRLQNNKRSSRSKHAETSIIQDTITQFYV